MAPRAGDPTLRKVGRVVKAHGIHGEVVVEPSTDSPDVRFAVNSVLLLTFRSGEQRSVTVTNARPHSGRLLVQFDGVAGRDASEALRGGQLFADIGDLPPTEDPDEFYDHELEGLTVVTVGGESVGTLREVLHGAGGELLVVDRADGSEALVPFVRQIVAEIDLSGGRVVVDPPPGLLEDA
ncbi:MAG TPA: ribosome maturation factor RimM [Pseudonocardiaceae bacterium]|jgi:16S rRNA processing protein RimM|nr:ribosome maturation factor RimM [Pseudonocardiaceae bacterium]